MTTSALLETLKCRLPFLQLRRSCAARPRPTPRRLCLETLEDRCLLSRHPVLDLETFGGDYSAAFSINHPSPVARIAVSAGGDAASAHVSPAHRSDAAIAVGRGARTSNRLVHAGESIQAAVNASLPGTTIHIQPGTYVEAIDVAKPDIRLIGLRGPHGEGVVITNPGDEENGITVTADGNGFELRNVTVRGFEENGVLLTGVDGFVLAHVTAENNGEYGLFPVRSSHGVIEHCTASGHSDTGLYVGQSHDVVIRHSTASANLIGISIENSSNIRVSHNKSYDNTIGILVTLEPGLAVTTSSDVLVDNNYVHGNNRANFAEPGGIEAFFPAGTGILVIGADRVTVRGNRVTGNRFVGIGVGSSLLVGAIAGLPPDAFASIEPNPDGAQILNNMVPANGGGPPVLFFPAADLLWDGSGTDNCWDGNTFAMSFPGDLPACRLGRHHPWAMQELPDFFGTHAARGDH